MATTPPVIQAKITAEPAKLPVAPLLIAVVVGVVIAVSAVGGGFYFLLRSGKVPIQVSAAPAAESVAPTKTRTMVLDPILVNLADSSGGAYLRVGVTLAVPDKGAVKGEKDDESKAVEKETNPSVRDTVLTVLGRQTSEDLLGPDGKDRLKRELKKAIAERNAEIRVSDIFFTEFLVQR
jgi:flagellar FliL protein